jgi:hypothetical protein
MSNVLGKISFLDTPDVNGQNVILTAGNIVSISADVFANRPAFGTAGRIFMATDTARTYRDTGAAWVLVADGNSDVVYQALTSTIAAQTATSTKAVSNVTPVSTDGTQIWTQAITPTFTTSRISISGAVYADNNTAGRKITLAFFRGTTCIGVACDYVATVAKGVMIPFNIVDSPATVAATTYSIRCFADLAGSWYINQGSTALYNGMLALNAVTVKELA